MKGQVKLVAHAQFLRGQIAEQESRWSNALAHYEHAARLDGIEDHLAAQARILWRLGRFDKAAPIAEDQRVLAAKIYDGNILQDAIRLNSLATLHHDQGRNDGAKLALETTIVIICAVHGSDHPDAQKYIADLAFIQKTKRD